MKTRKICGLLLILSLLMSSTLLVSAEETTIVLDESGYGTAQTDVIAEIEEWVEVSVPAMIDCSELTDGDVIPFTYTAKGEIQSNHNLLLKITSDTEPVLNNETNGFIFSEINLTNTETSEEIPLNVELPSVIYSCDAILGGPNGEPIEMIGLISFTNEDTKFTPGIWNTILNWEIIIE